jgi:hypothetical protein
VLSGAVLCLARRLREMATTSVVRVRRRSQLGRRRAGFRLGLDAVRACAAGERLAAFWQARRFLQESAECQRECERRAGMPGSCWRFTGCGSAAAALVYFYG